MSQQILCCFTIQAKGIMSFKKQEKKKEKKNIQNLKCILIMMIRQSNNISTSVLISGWFFPFICYYIRLTVWVSFTYYIMKGKKNTQNNEKHMVLIENWFTGNKTAWFSRLNNIHGVSQTNKLSMWMHWKC